MQVRTTVGHCLLLSHLCVLVCGYALQFQIVSILTSMQANIQHYFIHQFAAERLSGVYWIERVEQFIEPLHILHIYVLNMQVRIVERIVDHEDKYTNR